jgi:hypothetical protein
VGTKGQEATSTGETTQQTAQRGERRGWSRNTPHKKALGKDIGKVLLEPVSQTSVQQSGILESGYSLGKGRKKTSQKQDS